jgi:hypothetical protein
MVRINEIEFDKCAECHMLVSPSEYHPYAACVLYKQLGQADKVKSCLDSIIEYATRSQLKDGGAGRGCPHCNCVCSDCVSCSSEVENAQIQAITNDGRLHRFEPVCAACGKMRLWQYHIDEEFATAPTETSPQPKILVR